MTTRFGLSGGALGVVAGLCAGVAGVFGWYSLRPVSPPEPPQIPVASAPQPGAEPARGEAPDSVAVATPPSLGAATTASEGSGPKGTGPEAAAAPREPAQDAAAEVPAHAGAAPPPAEQAVEAEPPRFDTFRLGLDGSAVLAGMARGAAEVMVLVDGAEVARSRPDRGGRFAALFDLGLSQAARVLSLRAISAAGQEVASVETILIAPHQPAGAAVAQASASIPALGADQTSAAPEDTALKQASTAAETQSVSAAAVVDPAGATVQAAVATQAAEGDAAVAALAEPATDPAAPRQADIPAAQTAAPGGSQPDTPPAVEAGAAAVVAEAAPASTTLLIGDGTIRRLDAGPPPDGLAIDAISYDALGAVQIAGRGAPGQALRLYLNNIPKLDAMIDAMGRWQGELADVRPGLYTLRADQMDAAGKVTQRSETPFLREAPEALATVGAKDDQAAAPAVELVTVQPGYTLWGIAKSTYGQGTRYVQVFEANRGQIRNPDLIYPGQVFTLPELE